MDLFYGTYLRFEVKKLIINSKNPLSIREIEIRLHQYPTKREQVNFRNRIRLTLKVLIQQGIVKKEVIQRDSNLLFHQYAIND